MNDYLHNIVNNKKIIASIVLFFAFIFSLEIYFYLKLDQGNYDSDIETKDTVQENKFSKLDKNDISENKRILDEILDIEKLSQEDIKKNLEILESFNKK